MIVTPTTEEFASDRDHDGLIETNQGLLARVSNMPDPFYFEFSGERRWYAEIPGKPQFLFNVWEGKRGCNAVAWCGRSGKPLPTLKERDDKALVVSEKTITCCVMLEVDKRPFGIMQLEVSEIQDGLLCLRKTMPFSGLGDKGYLPKRLRKYNGIVNQARRLLDWGGDPEYFFSG